MGKFKYYQVLGSVVVGVPMFLVALGITAFVYHYEPEVQEEVDIEETIEVVTASSMVEKSVVQKPVVVSKPKATVVRDTGKTFTSSLDTVK